MSKVEEEGEVPAYHYLCDEEMKSDMDQEDLQPLQVKKEEEELYISQEGEQLSLKQETDSFMWTPTCEENDHSEDQTLYVTPEESAEQKESEVKMPVISSVVGAANIDQLQLLSSSSLVSVSHDERGETSGEDVEFEPQCQSHGGKDTGGRSHVCTICGRGFTTYLGLKVHMRSHTGEKSFSCKTCWKQFQTSSELTESPYHISSNNSLYSNRSHRSVEEINPSPLINASLHTHDLFPLPACRADVAPVKRRKFSVEFKEKAVQYAAETSGEQAAKYFNVDPKRIRDWRKQMTELMSADKRRARLAGGGRKIVSEELERKLLEWIYSMRDSHNRVSRRMIREKATETYPSVSDGSKPFVASDGWLCKFLRRNALTLRRHTTAAHRDPDLLTEKLVLFIDYVGKAVGSKSILEKDVIAMDETVVWFDTASPTTVDDRGTRGVCPKTAGNSEKSHLTVVLAARADGTKLRPYVVFKGAIRGMKAMRQQIAGAAIATSKNGWMNDDLTADWLRSVVGESSASPRLLVWDSYRCHISAATEAQLKACNVTAAVIPGGCTKHVHAPDVMWNPPFKRSLRDAYDEWMAGDAVKQCTSSGAVRAPARRLLVDWVVAAWERLDEELIVESFKVCGLTVDPDGSEDHLIRCFKEGEPAAGGREALAQLRRRAEVNRHQETYEEDEEELFNNELVVLHDEDDADGEEEIASGEGEEEDDDGEDEEF